MDGELRARLDEFGLLPGVFYETAPGTEVHNSPRHFPPILEAICSSVERAASIMHDLESRNLADSKAYQLAKETVEGCLDELKPYKLGSMWAIPACLYTKCEFALDGFGRSKAEVPLTGVVGVSRDSP